MKYPHENADKKDKAGGACNGGLTPAGSIDPAYDRYECKECGAGISFPKKKKRGKRK